MPQKRAGKLAILAAAVVILAVAVSAWAGVVRYEREQAYRTVSICLDYDDFASIASQWPEGALAYWKAMKKAGATSVAISEITLGWMEDAGYIELRALQAEGAIVKARIIPNDVKTASLLAIRLPARLGSMAEVMPDGTIVVSGLPLAQLREINAGPDEYAKALVSGAGLDIVFRLSAFGGFDSNWIEGALSQSLGKGSVVIFSEKQVGGFPNRLDEVAGKLKAEGAAVGQVEFSGQLGMDELCEKMAPYIVRVHSITPEELAKGMPMEVAVERFTRAVRERSMRLLYIRPYRYSGENSKVPAYNLEYVGNIAGALRESGYGLGAVPILEYTKVPDKKLLLAASALGASAAVYLIILPFSANIAVILSVFAAVFSMLLALVLTDGIASMLIPFASALVMPCLAASAWIGLMKGKLLKPTRKAVYAWALASAISLGGGLMLAAPISDVPHMLGVGVFAGIKVSQVLPLLFAFVAFWALLISKKGGKGLAQEARDLGMQPIRWWHAVVVGMAGILGLYMIIRSGNSNPALVTGFEEAARAALEKLLVFRPRSKEVFIGHPAMLLAGLLQADGFGVLALAAFTLGMVGQVSMANTFMHLHTPIIATLIRTGLGLVLGFAVGLIAVFAYRAISNAVRGRWAGR